MHIDAEKLQFALVEWQMLHIMCDGCLWSYLVESNDNSWLWFGSILIKVENMVYLVPNIQNLAKLHKFRLIPKMIWSVIA